MIAAPPTTAPIVMPASGTYRYTIFSSASTAPIGHTTVVVTIDDRGASTNEAFVAPTATARTTSSYDARLRLRAYSGANVGMPPLSIRVEGHDAVMKLGSTEQHIAIAHPACAVVADSLMSAMVMLPAVVNASQATDCTFVVPNAGRAVDAAIVAASPAPPSSALGGHDRALVVRIAQTTETIWYDPHTLVPDDLEAGAVHVRLEARSAATAPPVLATPAPLHSRYPSREVRFTSADGSSIAGTISYPLRGRAPFPAVLLIGGSGSNDRNEQVGSLHPFFDLSQQLNARGFAVLRYDKRFAGRSHSALAPALVTRTSYLDDVRAALATLRGDPRVNPAKIALVGHSEGGELALGAALGGAPVSALVLLAPLPMPYLAILDDQRKRGMMSSAMLAQLEHANAHFLASWNGIDPRAEIARVRQPILIVHGGRDENVTDAELAPLVAAARRARRRITLVTFEHDDHLFTHGTQPFDERVSSAVSAWLRSMWSR